MTFNNDDKLIVAKCEDLVNLCEKYCCERFSDFLDGAQQSIINDNIIFPYNLNVMMFGGFSDAEKKILGIFPEWSEPSPEMFPIKCIKIEGGFSRILTHRDYLGTILSLGIAQSKLGDIVVLDGFAYVFAHSDIADYISANIYKIGNQGVKISAVGNTEAIEFRRRYKTIGAICASERLDAVVAAAAKISRATSANLISTCKVKLNHREISKTSELVKEGDLLSIRGCGRFIVDKFGSETRSKRLHIVLKQYI